jgi:hypothetical protein
MLSQDTPSQAMSIVNSKKGFLTSYEVNTKCVAHGTQYDERECAAPEGKRTKHILQMVMYHSLI